MRRSLLLALSLLASAAAGQPPPRVYVGAYLTDVSDFDLKAGRFKADLRVWMKWLGSEQPPQLTFENAEIDSKDELGKESDGDWHSIQWRVQGTFRGDFPVHAFPFDRQTLPVVFSVTQTGAQLVPDLGASGMSPRFSVTGWLYEPYFNARSETRTFGSDLGAIDGEGHNTVLPRVAFTVEMRRPIAPYLLKFVLPLSLILLMALLALMLPPRSLEVRSGMGVTSLLSCIAFHYSQAETLPNVSYLVAADILFLGAYSLVTMTLLISVIVFRLHETKLETAIKIDRAFGFILPATAVALVFWLVLSATHVSEPKPVPVQRDSQPLLRIGSPSLDQLVGSGGPSRRSVTVVRGADQLWKPSLVEEAPSMTNPLVRLLPDGGMRVRWRLLPNTRWSDGSRVTVDDLKFSIETVANPMRTAIDAVDERTVDVTYSVRRREWLEPIVFFPRSSMQKVYADAGREAVMRAALEASVPTAAAYTLKEFTPGQSLVLERNPHFAGPMPNFERVEVVKVDAAHAADALKAHEVDVLPVLDGPTWAALSKEPNVKVLEQPGDLLYLLVPNLTQAPWDKLEARQAVLAAIDRQALADVFKPAPAQVAATWRATTPPAPTVPYDPTGAAASLSALGLKGAKLKLHVTASKAKDTPVVVMAAKIAADLTRAGLEVEIVEHAETGPLFNKRDFDGLLFLSRETSDPTRYLNVPFANGHYEVELPHGAHFDAKMVAAWEDYASSLYDERRIMKEKVLRALWAERLPMLPLVLTSRLSAVRADLVGPTWGQADALYWNVGDWRFEGSGR
jgi:peptide/nickel transport system substrate-binding protein